LLEPVPLIPPPLFMPDPSLFPEPLLCLFMLLPLPLVLPEPDMVPLEALVPPPAPLLLCANAGPVIATASAIIITFFIYFFLGTGPSRRGNAPVTLVVPKVTKPTDNSNVQSQPRISPGA
jgi:hypothetical protein